MQIGGGRKRKREYSSLRKEMTQRTRGRAMCLKEELSVPVISSEGVRLRIEERRAEKEKGCFRLPNSLKKQERKGCRIEAGAPRRGEVERKRTKEI